MSSNIAGTCDFETDLCSWSNPSVGDDFDWVRNQGRTQTLNTGPLSDHTLGSQQGISHWFFFCFIIFMY